MIPPPCLPATLEIQMTRPQRRAIIPATTALRQTKPPRRLIESSLSKSSVEISQMGMRCVTPALLTRMSTGPMSCTAARTELSSVTSINTARLAAPIAAALRVAPSMSMSLSTTSAPAVAKARAIAFPRPLAEPAPVTNATLPASVTHDILCVASIQSHKPEFDVGGPDPLHARSVEADEQPPNPESDLRLADLASADAINASALKALIVQGARLNRS